MNQMIFGPRVSVFHREAARVDFERAAAAAAHAVPRSRLLLLAAQLALAH